MITTMEKFCLSLGVTSTSSLSWPCSLLGLGLSIRSQRIIHDAVLLTLVKIPASWAGSQHSTSPELSRIFLSGNRNCKWHCQGTIGSISAAWLITLLHVHAFRGPSFSIRCTNLQYSHQEWNILLQRSIATCPGVHTQLLCPSENVSLKLFTRKF